VLTPTSPTLFSPFVSSSHATVLLPPPVELKSAALEVYNRRLKDRLEKRAFVIDNDLVEQKKVFFTSCFLLFISTAEWVLRHFRNQQLRRTKKSCKKNVRSLGRCKSSSSSTTEMTTKSLLTGLFVSYPNALHHHHCILTTLSLALLL